MFQFASSVSSFSLNIYSRLIGHPLSEQAGGLDENRLAEIVQVQNDDYRIWEATPAIKQAAEWRKCTSHRLCRQQPGVLLPRNASVGYS